MTADRAEDRERYLGPSPVEVVLSPTSSRPSLTPLRGGPQDHLVLVLEHLQDATENQRKAILILAQQGRLNHEAMCSQLDRIEAAQRAQRDSIPDLVADAVADATGPHAAPEPHPDAITPGKLEARITTLEYERLRKRGELWQKLFLLVIGAALGVAAAWLRGRG